MHFFTYMCTHQALEEGEPAGSTKPSCSGRPDCRSMSSTSSASTPVTACPCTDVSTRPSLRQSPALSTRHRAARALDGRAREGGLLGGEGAGGDGGDHEVLRYLLVPHVERDPCHVASCQSLQHHGEEDKGGDGPSLPSSSMTTTISCSPGSSGSSSTASGSSTCCGDGVCAQRGTRQL